MRVWTSFIFIFFYVFLPFLLSAHFFRVCTVLSFFVNSPASLLLSAPSLRLSYKDLEQQRKIEEQKFKGLDAKKKVQAERLGMGLGMRRYGDDDEETSHPVAGFKNEFSHLCFFLFIITLFFCSGVSHSVTSDMHIIQQENPRGTKTTKGRRYTEEEDDEGCFSSRSDNENS